MSYLDLDFKTSKQASNTIKSTSPRSFNMLLIIVSTISAIIAFIFVFLLVNAPNTEIPITQTIDLTIKPIPTPPAPVEPITISTQIPTKEIEVASDIPKTTLTTKSITIKHGDTLSSAFNKQGINASVLYNVINDSKDGKLLKNIRKGEKFDFIFSNNKLMQLLYHPDITQTYSFSRNSKGQFTSALSTNPLEAIPAYREGTINSSLFLAAEKSNIPVNVIMNMVGIFGWDIDFALDIRKGDSFKLIYNELYQDGQIIKNGRILAAEFTNRNKVYQAIFYTDLNGNSNYYSPDGKSMRKAFLRNPVKFSRISSRFNKNRKHPIHGFKRPHRGVDYAANRGTPIYSAGDGKIIYRGRKGGYGRTIVVKHGGKYTTLYAHMNSYNRKLKKGSHVKQGQTIGYVGKSGTATGYHLHYEFRLSGVHRNPLTVKLPAARPINEKYKSSFNQTKNKLLHMLKVMEQS